MAELTDIAPAFVPMAHRIVWTYWLPEQDTCTAEAAVTWVLDDQGRRAAWEQFGEGELLTWRAS